MSSAKSALERARETPGSTKSRILDSAEGVFATRGFDGASTREIAARAGVNISSLHYHWASKETLYVAVIRNIFDRLVELLDRELTPVLERHDDLAEVVDRVMTRLFDFFADHPNVPKLLLRRIVEQDAGTASGVERDVLVPAWDVFTEWLTRFGHKLSDVESRLFMLSIHSILLVYLIDGAAYRSVLHGSVHEPLLREQVRTHIIRVVRALLSAPALV